MSPARFLLALASLLVAAFPVTAAPERWTAEIDRLVAGDAAQPPTPGGIVFVGSSSIRLWSTLATDFPAADALNRGFGGSELADSVYYAARLVLPYRPRAVVVYAGENDLWNGKSPAALLEDFRALRTRVHAALPGSRIIFLSIKYSPARERIHPQIGEANRLIAADCASAPSCLFVDVATPLFGPDGRSDGKFFLPDGIHLNAGGYQAWTRVLAPYLRE